jgi:hypothetical protein
MCVKSFMKSDVKSYREHENPSIHELKTFCLLMGTISDFLDPALSDEFYPYPILSKDSKSCGFHYILVSSEFLFCSVVEMSAKMGSQLQRVSPKPQGHKSHRANPVLGRVGLQHFFIYWLCALLTLIDNSTLIETLESMLRILIREPVPFLTSASGISDL